MSDEASTNVGCVLLVIFLLFVLTGPQLAAAVAVMAAAVFVLARL